MSPAVKSAATMETITVESTVSAAENKAAVGVVAVVRITEAVAITVGIIAIPIGVVIIAFAVVMVVMLLSLHSRHADNRQACQRKKRERHLLE
jgi:hypothetical protein